MHPHWPRLARENGEPAHRHPWGGDPVRVDQVVELLQNACDSGDVLLRQRANELLEWMSAKSWFIRSGSKKGGIGGSTGPDNSWHITLEARGAPNGHKGFHLRQLGNKFHANGQRLVFQITSEFWKGAPHRSPGTDIEE
jgi:hypothetical protein